MKLNKTNSCWLGLVSLALSLLLLGQVQRASAQAVTNAPGAGAAMPPSVGEKAPPSSTAGATNLVEAGVSTQPPTQRSVVIDHAPPPPRLEVVPLSPGRDYAWIPGFWAYHGGEWEWVSGCWVLRPGPKFVWSDGHWAKHGRSGYIWINGHWVLSASPASKGVR